MLTRATKAGLILLAASCLVMIAACDGKESYTVPTKMAPPTVGSPPPGTPPPTQEPFQGARQPIEKPPQGTGQPRLFAIRWADHGSYDRMTFEFDGNALPGYSVKYITPAEAVSCGSGEPANVIGSALLQVRFFPAAAHNDDGAMSFDNSRLPPALDTLGDAVLTCDFEGVVIWVLGLAKEVDFRVIELSSPPRLAVDVAR